ncbi:hypothetical protein FBULB1_3903 [Fusarium bulbicola]|nr:hypothetical protein FBULB1_3903 [Fusarium bulbicola]
MDTPLMDEWLTATSTDIVAFAHCEYQASVFDVSEVWHDIFNDLYSQKAPDSIFVISPDVEYRRDNIRRGFEKSGQNEADLMITTYTAWTEHVQTGWSTAGPTFKGYSIVLIDLDPSMTVECAMALLVTTHFVMDTAEDSMTRLITVSCTNVDHAFERLSAHLNLPRPKSFRVQHTSTENSADQQTIYCRTMSELHERFQERIRDREGNHIALVYNSQNAVGALGVDDSWNFLPFEDLFIQHGWESDVSSGICGNWILHFPDGSHPRMGLSGYNHIHMVVRPENIRTSFDLSVGQLTNFAQLLSFEERIEFRSVFRRLQEPPSSATLYVIGEQEEKGEWWLTGPAIRRQDVWNRSLGAFMTLVASLGPRVDAAATVECFVPEGMFTIYETMEYRLKAHGLLKWNSDQQLILGLERHEFVVFRAVLPFVGHDYRLAYFVAQESQTASDALLQTKVQLAAVVNSGGATMFDFDETLASSVDSMQNLIDACIGYSKPLSKQGSMWLALGLWKRLANRTSNFKNIPPDGRLQVPGIGSLTADTSGCIKAHHSWSQMSCVLANCGIQTTQKEYDDETILSESECRDIQSHLFRAYLSQLTACCRGFASNGAVEFRDLSSKRMINGFSNGGGFAMDYSNISNDEPTFGVYHNLERFKNGSIGFGDFTFIPSGLVVDWVWAFRDRMGDPTIGIESMFRVGGGPRRNYDGMKDEVWEPKDW